jgi:PAS domain S-box-containing protein
MLLSMLALVNLAYAERAEDCSVVADFISMGLPTSVALAALSLGILGARPNRGLMAVLTGPGPGGVMARRLLPACVLVPLLIGWVGVRGERLNYYGPSTGASVLIVANVVVVIGLIWVNAGLIDRMEDQRLAAHNALRESEVFYHSLVENLPQNILRKDRSGHFTFVNRRFAETVGRSVGEIVGRTDADLFPAPLAGKYRADDLRVMDADSPFEVVEEHVTPDGQTHYVQVIKTPLHDASGAILGVQGIFWDVTDRWRYETRLRQQNEQLAAMAESERRAHDELKQAQSRMVQTAKLAGLGEMVAGVAHEINNPLSYVGNNVAVLQRDLDEIRRLLALYEEGEPSLATADPDLMARIERFRDEADLGYTLENLDGLLSRTRDGLKRIQRIVGDLRVFARLDEGDLGEVDLNAGIESTIGIVLGNAKKKQVEIHRDLAPLPPVTCFGTKINQVVMNLVSNSIDACDEGGEIRVVTRTEPDGVRLEVHDDGCGIPPEVRERIFDPFFTTKPVGVGTGLGLSISYGIVQDHGGTIEVDSAPGVGTCFRVFLPYRVARREPAEATDSLHSAPPGTAAPTRRDQTETHA